MATIRFNTQFPGYEVLSELGRSNARILKARHLATGELVAIKHFALHTDADTLRRFQQESDIMRGINHPNIVKIREVRLDAELPYLVMELLEGGNLRSLLAGPMPPDIPTITRLGLQMASAFRAFHPQGIVHRDIKPENILYRPLPSGELHFLLTDFGVARLREQSQTMTGQSLMTYEYASPEQFDNPKSVSAATDYYSLGVVLYECLTGQVPFVMGDQAGIVTFMNKVLHDVPPALTATPAGESLAPFADLVQGLLAKKAADRISDPDELTWHLKQAELNHLQASRNRPAVAPLPVSLVGKEPRLDANNRSAPASPESSERQNSNQPGWLKWLVLGVLILFVGEGIYYFSTPSSVLRIADRPASDSSATITDNTTGQMLPPVDSTEIRRAEAARRQEQRRLRVLTAVSQLSVEVVDYKIGFLGGISEAQLKLTNPGPVTFTSVAVLVKYFKEKGGLFKSETVIFTDVGPNASPIRNAPDSDRGTRLTCKITGYTLPDSLMLPTDSLHRTLSIDSQN